MRHPAQAELSRQFLSSAIGYARQRPLATTYLIGLGAILIVLVGRLIWVCAGTEIGWSTVQRQWCEATLGWIEGETIPVSAQEPPAQAEFWLAEIERVLRTHGDDPQMLIGAAWVLDFPATDFVATHLKVSYPLTGSIPVLLQDDQQEIERGVDAFEARCGRQSLHRATRAVELAPENKSWRRLQALLVWRNSYLSSKDHARSPDWREIFDSAARHDPENAIYDYLAAHLAWGQSCAFDRTSTDAEVKITNPALFQVGERYFAQGQAKPFVALADEGYEAVAKFLDHTALPLDEQTQLINSRLIHARGTMLLVELARMQLQRAANLEASGQANAAADLLQQNLRLIDQFIAVESALRYDQLPRILQIRMATELERLAQTHPTALSKQDLTKIAALSNEAKLQRAILNNAARQTLSPRQAVDLREATIALIVAALPTFIVVLLAFAGVASLTIYFCRSVAAPLVGKRIQLVFFFVALALTSVFFGMAPAKIIPPEYQEGALSLLLMLTPLVLLLLFIVRLVQRRTKISLRSLLLWFGVGSLFIGAVILALPLLSHIVEQLPSPHAIPEREIDPVTRGFLTRSPSPAKTWIWAALQWRAYYGAAITLALWLLALSLLQRRRMKASSSDALRRRDVLAAVVRLSRRAALVLAGVLLLTYLVLAPTLLLSIERHFQRSMAFARNPAAYWANVEQAVQQQQADESN